MQVTTATLASVTWGVEEEGRGLAAASVGKVKSTYVFDNLREV